MFATSFHQKSHPFFPLLYYNFFSKKFHQGFSQSKTMADIIFFHFCSGSNPNSRLFYFFFWMFLIDFLRKNEVPKGMERLWNKFKVMILRSNMIFFVKIAVQCLCMFHLVEDKYIPKQFLSVYTNH